MAIKGQLQKASLLFHEAALEIFIKEVETAANEGKFEMVFTYARSLSHAIKVLCEINGMEYEKVAGHNDGTITFSVSWH